MSGISEDGEETFKTLIIGKSGVGKSTILVHFIDGKFEKTVATVALDVQIKRVQYNDAKFKLELSDTAGQERYRTIVKNYFNLTKAALVVFDLQDPSSIDDAKYWLEELSQKCGVELPKLLLGNKCDMLTPEELKQTLAEVHERLEALKKSYNCEFRVVSGKTGENIVKTFDRLTELIYEHYLEKKLGGAKGTGGVKLTDMAKDRKKEDENTKKKCC